MNNKQWVTLLGLLGLWFWYSLQSAEQTVAFTTSEGLTGVMVEIDAAKFATLQDAIDQVPAEGGVVRLPAGL